MRGLCIFAITCMLIFQAPTYAFSFFQKKDYKQIILNNAYNAEKRKDYKSAFHSYEKATYYYKKDVKVLEAYATFCERKNYYDKAQDLYSRLYVLTKNPKYLFKVNICAIKNGKLANKDIEKITSNKALMPQQKKDLSKALIFHYSYKKDWKKVKQTCDRLKTKDIGLDIVKTCIAASENTSDKKSVLRYSVRNSELSPQDADIINKIIILAEILKDYKTEGIFVKKLSDINPNDKGIKYKLAGVYEKQKDWSKAARVYEALMLMGDKSEHVTSSYNYVQSELHPKKQPFIIYKPKPLSPFKIAEKQFYAAWKAKDYTNAQIYLSKMLAEQPNNKKLLKHRVDIDVSQENYAAAIQDFEKVNTNSVEDTKFLAFLYSKTDDNKKALEIIENALQTSPDNKELLALALQYSMAEKNWDRAIIYSKKLLAFMPNSEKLLKIVGDLYSAKEDFPNALEYYEKLVKLYPKLEYQTELANLYMANKEFESAETLLAPLYEQYPDNKKIITAYLNSLSAQQKLLESYCVIKDKNLFETKEGYEILGDLDMKYKHYDSAGNNYYKALQFEPESLALQNKLADSYRLFGCIEGAEKIYCNILRKDPKYIGARMGLGSIEIKRKHFNNARSIFCCILQEKPDYKPAKVGIAYSYIANGDRFSALDTLSQVEPDDETKLLKANIYYDMGMLTDAKQTIASSNSLNSNNWNAKDLKYKIKRDNAITITPTYSFLKQTLGENFRLNYHMGGIRVAQNIDRNTNVFMNYNVYAYTSEDSEGLTNVTNEFRGGVHGHPAPRWEYNTDVGVKVFEHDNGSMIVTDDWVKYNVTDNLALKLGFFRDNLIQTYTSAVGRYINGVFTGRVADTRTYLEYDMKFPHDCYSFGRAAYGVMYAQNLPTNQYLEGMLGVGKLLYNNPKNPIIQKVNFDLVSFNWTYQYNLLNIYNSAGVLFGGYFSPNFFSSNTANLKLQGEIKKLRLKYGCTGFAGVQTSNAPVFTELAWGVGPFVSYRLNEHIDINASYQYFDWAFMKRHIFMVSAVFRGFRRNGQS